jgi:ubiquinone/menaquinone biosynthesis C-methylase UbiE
MYERVQKQFGRAVDAYSHSPAFADGEDLRWLVEHAGPEIRDHVLDLGTGAGHTAFALASSARLTVGLDITPQMVQASCRTAKERNIASFQACVGNAEQLPFPDESFSLVASRFTAHHIHNPARMVQEVARVLTANGLLLIVDNTSPDNAEADRWINRVEVLRDPSHVREWSKAEWQGFFQAAGLCFTISRTWLKMLEFDDWVARQQTPPDQVSELREIFASVPPAIRETFAIDGNDFGLVTRLMVGRKQ